MRKIFLIKGNYSACTRVHKLKVNKYHFIWIYDKFLNVSDQKFLPYIVSARANHQRESRVPEIKKIRPRYAQLNVIRH